MTTSSDMAGDGSSGTAAERPDVTAAADIETPMEPKPFSRIAVLRIALMLVAAALAWFRVGEIVPGVDVVSIAALVVGGWPVLREAAHSVLSRRMTMELSMVIAIGAAAAIAEYFTALVVATFVLFAEELERLTLQRGRTAIGDLMSFIPHIAHVRRGDAVTAVPVDSLVAGDVVLLTPGDAVPVDGVVVAGRSAMDQARITGESIPAEVEPGDRVYAGSVNQAGSVDVEVESVGRDTSYGRIVQAVETAAKSRAPVQRLADRLAGYLVYFAAAAAAVTFLVTGDLRDTISVVIVAGACGIAAGTPLAILGGIGRAAAFGSVIKGGRHLEMLGRVDTVVLDKTGTLTFGEPVVTRVVAAEGSTEADVLRFAAAAEARSEHPLARAVVQRAAADGLALPETADFSYVPGRGVRVLVDRAAVLVGNMRLLGDAGVAVPAHFVDDAASEILVARDGAFVGSVLVADTIRPESVDAVRAMKRLGIRPVLLTGDVGRVATAVAAEIGIEDVEAGLLPEDKLTRVRALGDAGAIVAMVGDGVNDAPALSEAAIGVAMGSGTDIAKETADIMLIGSDLSRFVETIRVARWTRRVIMQNFVGTLAVDALGMLLAATGNLDPLLAGFIHVASEFVFLSNSARLLAPSRARRPAVAANAAARPAGG